MNSALKHTSETSTWATAGALLAILVGAGLAVFWAITSITSFAPVATIAIGFWQFSRNQKAERAAAREELRREGKTEAYTKLVNHWIDLFNKNDTKKQAAAKRPEAFFELTKDQIPWASDDVLRTWVEMRGGALEGRSRKPLEAISKMFIAVRNDLGLETTLHEWEVLALFINDMDEEKWHSLEQGFPEPSGSNISSR